MLLLFFFVNRSKNPMTVYIDIIVISLSCQETDYLSYLVDI
ncbi:hypothetical protein M092_0153 [Parabacteroides distasonis str. 3776 D15 iv]|uniref:Uncharacterized protein n=1 Tax=Parabacteroides distasonis str. 3776 D15 i TaxID=1339342 RepID=A0AB34LCU0_PARDI|nr:hypothetical protein M091_0064 [Parabacteroides distasonis str. 3776 D15 i]KDS43039.1 hypothetical protein M090_0175 [Parabacteroides distasonis str. 3776 Po2 i]KDS73981.1 hypothetical protein M092_0153 [Parabacteroides distasonis str. 3776 D15 iv]